MKLNNESGVVENRTRSTAFWLTVVIGIGLAYCVGMAFGWGSPRSAAIVGSVGQVIVLPIAGVSLMRAGQRSRGTQRAMWLFLSSSSFAYFAGQLVWSYYQVIKSTTAPYPSWADVGFVALYPLAFAGLAFRSHRQSGRITTVLDGLLIAASALMISWALVLGPVYHAGDYNQLGSWVGLIYPVGDVMAATMALTMLAAYRGASRRLSGHTPLVLLSVGYVLYAIGDGIRLTQALTGPVATGSIADFTFIVGALLFAVAATSVGRPSPDVAAGSDVVDSKDGQADGEASKLSLLLPYFVFVVAATVFIAQVATDHQPDLLDWVAIGSVVVTLLSRQGLVLRTNMQLARELAARERVSTELAAALSRDKSLLDGVIFSIPHMVYWKDADLKYVGYNDAFLSWTGLDQATAISGQTNATLRLHVEIADVLTALEIQVLQTDVAILDHRVTVTEASGEHRNLLLSVLPRSLEGSVAGVIAVGADITHLDELERKVAQGTRLESIGQLAAGLAHEINTPVQYISDNSRFVATSITEVIDGLHELTGLAAETPPPDDFSERLRSILDSMDVEFLKREILHAMEQSLDGLERVASIVAAMKDFSHPGRGRSAIEVNRAIESSVQVCHNEWRDVAEVSLDLADDVGSAPCFGGELKQVLLNLIVNAAQAIGAQRREAPGAPLGRISVTTRRIDDNLQISVEDNGPGMDEATRRRVFDPFFTTKQVGEGTGQGLSIAYTTIVKQHGGTLEVKSAPGAGATFLITLPYRVEETSTPQQKVSVAH